MITRNFILHLTAGLASPLVINVNQYDQGEQWLFTLYNQDGTQYVPSSGAIVGIKSDNLGIINSGSVDGQGRVVINETQQMTAAVGKAVFELVIDDGTHGTANFIVLVEAKPGDNADLSESDLSLIEQAIEAASSIKPYGSPLVASTVAGMTDHDKVYVYVGSETGYTSGNWYYWDGSAWTSGGVYNSVAVQTDTTLTLSGVAADAKKTGDEIADLKSQIANAGMKDSIKQALIAFLNTCVSNDPSAPSLLDALEAVLYEVEVISISASFVQGENIVWSCDTLNSLKQYLTVTAHYDNGTSAEVSAYALSGTLADGTSTITVTYMEKTTTFTVDVTEGTDVTPALNTFVANTNSYIALTSNEIRVYNNATATYTYARAPIELKKDYSYYVTCEVDYTSGDDRIGFRDKGQGSDTGTSVGMKTLNKIDETVDWVNTPSSYQTWSDSTSPTQSWFFIFATYATKERGDVTIKNLRIIEHVAESVGE